MMAGLCCLEIGLLTIRLYSMVFNPLTIGLYCNRFNPVMTGLYCIEFNPVPSGLLYGGSRFKVLYLLKKGDFFFGCFTSFSICKEEN